MAGLEMSWILGEGMRSDVSPTVETSNEVEVTSSGLDWWRWTVSVKSKNLIYYSDPAFGKCCSLRVCLVWIISLPFTPSPSPFFITARDTLSALPQTFEISISHRVKSVLWCDSCCHLDLCPLFLYSGSWFPMVILSRPVFLRFIKWPRPRECTRRSGNEMVQLWKIVTFVSRCSYESSFATFFSGFLVHSLRVSLKCNNSRVKKTSNDFYKWIFLLFFFVSLNLLPTYYNSDSFDHPLLIIPTSFFRKLFKEIM